MNEPSETKTFDHSSEQSTMLAFDKWAESCLQEHDNDFLTILRKESKTFFSLQSLADPHSRAQSDDESLSQSLAQLISKLGPVFNMSIKDGDTFYPPVAGLYVLCGALEGVLERDKKSININSNTGLSQNIQTLLGKFLLERCRIDTNIQEIKDIAIMCLHALLKTTNQSAEEKKGTTSKLKKHESMMWRLNLARRAVMLSAGVTYEEEDDVDDGENHEELYSVGKISDFTRLKRTACFNILSSALHGFKLDFTFSDSTNTTMMENRLLTEISKFASFCVRCLHGESDPRCLILLLKLINSCQKQFLPFFSNAKETNDDIVQQKHQKPQFPTTSIFDSVAPYYPIKFTPPPNIENAISREDLEKALMSVLTCYPPEIAQNSSNMMAMSSRLFLERIFPHSDDDDYGMSPGSEELNSLTDKLEALDDLNLLLHSRPCYTLDGMQQEEIESLPFQQLEDAILVTVAEALIETHFEATKADTDPASFESSEEKLLASKCRDFALFILSLLEQQKHTASLSSKWKIFLNTILNSLSSDVTSAPESFRGRTSAMFLSSIACSGPETLRSCLRSCLPPMLDSFEGTLDSKDEERITASSYALASFFAAVTKLDQIRMERHKGKMVLLHPHPLDPYGGNAFRLLIALIHNRSNEHTNITKNSMEDDVVRDKNFLCHEARAAAVYAVEALLLASPMHILSNDEFSIHNEIEALFTLLTASVCDNDNDDNLEPSDSREKWQEMCAHAIGSVIGKCPHISKGGDFSVIDAEMKEDINIGDYCCITSFTNLVQTTIIPLLIQSATKSINTGSIPKEKRYDLMALARGCVLQRDFASFILVSIGTSLIKALDVCLTSRMNSPSKDEDVQRNTIATVSISMALSFMIENGGNNAKSAWDICNIETPNSVNPVGNKEHIGFYILRALCGYRDGSEINIVKSEIDDVVMDKLILPSEENAIRNGAEQLVEVASKISPYLNPCYGCSTPDLVNSIIRFIAPKIPPLSMLDDANVTITLPILSASLQSAKDTNKNLLTTVTAQNNLQDMIPSLCEFILSNENGSSTRSAAASILYTTLFKSPESTKLATDIIENCVSKAILIAAGNLNQSKDEGSHYFELGRFEDILNLMSLVGAAVACKGGFQASILADKVMNFLVALICDHKAHVPDTDFEVAIPPKYKRELSTSAAQAFGAMIALESGGQFWKQRLCYKALPSILNACDGGASIGPHVAAAHMLCCVSMKALSAENVKKLYKTIIDKLIISGNLVVGNSTNPEDVFVHVALGAITKLLSLLPDLVTSHTMHLFQCLMDICCNDNANTLMTFMALQCIMIVVSIPDVRQRLSQKFKLEVLGRLSALLDHRSRVVRQASVMVRNEWCMLS